MEFKDHSKEFKKYSKEFKDDFIGSVEIAGQDFKLSSRFARWFAQWLDFLVLLIPPVFVIGVLGRLGIAIDPLFAAALIWIGFYLLFQDGINKGRSFGKRIMSMRVVNAETGGPCSYGKSILRNLFILIPLVNIIDALMIFGDKRQRLGDKLAKTLVVKGNPPKNGVPADPPKTVKTFCVGFGILVGFWVIGYALLEEVPRNFESTDGLVQIRAPFSWNQLRTWQQSNQDSTLEVYDSSGETVVQVITETKEELDSISLGKFAKLVTGIVVSNLSQPVTVGNPIQTTLNGYSAIQYEIHGSLDNDRVFYLHTSIEGKHHYHQVVGFTVSEKTSTIKPKLQQIIESFKELP